MILLSAADYFGHLTKSTSPWDICYFTLLQHDLFMLSVVSIPADGSSMSPTLNPNPRSLWNDYLILRPIKAADVECGDVVTFSYPYDPSRRLIKRVIAKEGETVRYHSGMVGHV
jgi:signal peptidase I